MKKIFVLFFVLGFVMSAHAEFSWQLIADFNTGLFARGIPTGERAERVITVDGIDRPNNHLHNPISNERGNFTYTTGYLDLFSYGSGQLMRGNELRMAIGFQRNNIQFHTLTLLDILVRPDLSDGRGLPNEFAPDHSLVQNPRGIRNVNWGDFLRYSFEEFFFRGNVNFLTLFVGNTHDRGKVDNFDVFTDDVLRTIRVPYFGVLTPDVNADFLDGGTDTNNFLRQPRVRATRAFGQATDSPFGTIDIPYFMIGVDFSTISSNFTLPFTLQIAADPGNNSGVNAGGGVNPVNDFDFTQMNGGVRLSGANLFDWVTFDAIWRFKGGDPNTLDNFDENLNPGGYIQPDGLGVWAHSFGLYTNIVGLPDINIGVGYSGYVKIFEEDRETGPNIISRTGPFFNGFDLRIQYTGIDRLTITSSNNFSIGAIRRSIEDPVIAIGVLGTELQTGTSQQWIGIYNAIGFNYQLTEQLTASLQLGNRFGRITTVYTPLLGGRHTTTRSRNQFGGGAYLAYQMNAHLTFQGGFLFRHLHDSYTNTAPGAQGNFATRNASGGMIDFSIPIRARFVFN